MHCHTPLNPESEAGIQQLVDLFLGQSTGDIKHQVQKIRGLTEQDVETWLEEAWRVFSNRKEGCKERMRKLVTGVREEEEKGRCGQGPPRQKPPWLGKDQCAFCKKNEHWKDQCPK